MLLTCWVAATMNPGYKGCTVIPDGLQAQLRPIAMLVPDYGLIAQINCLSFGFSQWEQLEPAIVQCFDMCEAVMSKQPHYDHGMRAVKSVLTTAKSLKRKSRESAPERTIIWRAISDVMRPKLTTGDQILFDEIRGSLFAGIEARNALSDGGTFVATVKTCAIARDL